MDDQKHILTEFNNNMNSNFNIVIILLVISIILQVVNLIHHW